MNKVLILVGTAIVSIISFIVFAVMGFDFMVLESALLLGIAITILIIIARYRKSEKKTFQKTRTCKKSEAELESVEYAEYKRDQKSLWALCGVILVIYLVVIIIGGLTGNYSF